MICEYCGSQWFPSRFHPGCCGECGAPRLRSAPQADAFQDYMMRGAIERSTVPSVLMPCGERVEVDWTKPGGVVHLPPGGAAEVICPEVDGKTMREILSETFPYETWNAMSVMNWRLG